MAVLLTKKLIILPLFLSSFSLLFFPRKIGVTLFFTSLVAFLSLWISYLLAKQVLAFEEGSESARKIAEAIREGSTGFLRVQFKAITRFSIICAFVIFFAYFARNSLRDSSLTNFQVALVTFFCFLTGAACSAAVGYLGMCMSVRANSRVAFCAGKSYELGLSVCLRSGAVTALLVVSLCLLGIIFLYSILYLVLPISYVRVPFLLVGYGFGASFVALFAQLGGGIYTKAADVGADIIGKVERDIPEDDPRNPATIADLVGDNVGDCAGRGSDLFESIAAEIISAMILGGVLAQRTNVQSGMGFVLFPLGLHASDLIVSTIGILSIRPRKSSNHPDVEAHPGKLVGEHESPFSTLFRGYKISLILAGICIIILSYLFLYTSDAPDAWWHFALCGMIGLLCAVAFIKIAQYYTDSEYGPVKLIAEASTSGHGTNVIVGLSVGMISVGLFCVIICIALVLTYRLGQDSGLYDRVSNGPTGGLFGTAIATMGMLSTAVYILAMDMFGPIADNAGDSVGNTTKAVTKGYAIGSAALASFLLFSAFLDEIRDYTGRIFEAVDLSIPEVFVSGFFGSIVVYVFSGYTMKSVGIAAQAVVTEVRRQVNSSSKILSGEEIPDYQACVAIVTQEALKQMVAPGAIAIFSPIVVGYVFRFLYPYDVDPLLPPKCVASFLMFATSSGVLMSLFLSIGGGAFDNAKKYIETGVLGGKGSETHKAAVTGDTVGDPMKDTYWDQHLFVIENH
ncbi:Pyrophosphate-energized membrane proton pump 3 [Galdieria sulphuraria]|nr:Pyrophosphate-energized membrane proton pump 3 [Galdieria sulphuraria]